jgi:DNA repair protein RAD50
VDGEIEEAQEPKRELEATYKAESLARKAKIDEAQQLYQEYNMNVDKLQTSNKAIERFMREGVERKLQDCAEKKEDLEAELNEFTQRINEAKAALESLDLEARSGESTLANLRQNIQFRKLAKQITSTQSEIDTFDMEEAAKARRNFEEKYPKEKEREEKLHSKLAHLGGELSSQKQQLKEWDDDLKDFKDIYKKYTDQLITVKMSDMANNDLEKYAKALDNAIMKYHTLKMEEVNDTMKHLWNKTYQGTDIDGIRIRADSEGGTTKRSYNYRVVMVKDQVEMDMRGRCSAGQKMLASIIIRLALSDSFGQNCGILALDEPTNALDTENIDALASSLVDIINERKGHASFQLIIITHDENFLKKLGQNSVMEYYWRVSRDSRQKSVIERQRFM